MMYAQKNYLRSSTIPSEHFSTLFEKNSWVVVIKCKRLVMTILEVFIESPLYRVPLLLTTTLVHLLHHTIVKP